MLDSDDCGAVQGEAPLWARLLLLALANALSTFVLCAVVLMIESAAAGMLLLVGLSTVPVVSAAAVAGYSARARAARWSAPASLGYFVSLLVLGVAVEAGTLWALVQIYWGGPQLGA